MEPQLQAVLASTGLNAECVAAEGNTLLRKAPDGREIPVVDYAGGYGSLLLGHHHPAISAYARELLETGVPVHAQFSVHSETDHLAQALSRVLLRELGTDEPYCAILASRRLGLHGDYHTLAKSLGSRWRRRAPDTPAPAARRAS